MNITLIGISDQKPLFSQYLKEKIANASVFAGGHRHNLLVNDLLPQNALWLMITVPLDDFLLKLSNCTGDVVVFASGDPLFFGIGNTLKNRFPKATIQSFPIANSLQMLANKLQVNYGLYKTISLTGRDWSVFDQCLINGETHMAVLTDRTKTPTAIAQRMCDYGYVNYKIHIGESLGGLNEKISSYPIAEICNINFSHPNCFLLEKTSKTHTRKGIPDELFHILEGRPKMITKMPVRITTLALMGLHHRQVMWDVGSCTGSLAIEAKLHAPHLNITAFEIRPESEEIITANCKKFGAPGINLVIGNFCDYNCETLIAPDAIFVGGYGGKMHQLLNHCNKYLKTSGVLAFNAVTHESKSQFLNWISINHYKLISTTAVTVDNHNTINILITEKA